LIYVFVIALAIAYAFAKFYLGFWTTVAIIILVVILAFLRQLFREILRLRMKVTLRDGRTGFVRVPAGMEMDASLDALMNGTGAFSDPSVELTSGEVVQRKWIVSARPGLR
jgi:hypothetical protein